MLPRDVKELDIISEFVLAMVKIFAICVSSECRHESAAQAA